MVLVPVRHNDEFDRRRVDFKALQVPQRDGQARGWIDEAIDCGPTSPAEVDYESFSAPPAKDRNLNLIWLRCGQGDCDSASCLLRAASARSASASARRSASGVGSVILRKMIELTPSRWPYGSSR